MRFSNSSFLGHVATCKSRIQVPIAAVFLLALVLAACSRSEAPATAEGGKAGSSGGGKTYTAEGISCELYTVDDAAEVLGTPAEQIKVNAQQLYPGNLNCSFNGGGLDRRVSFNLSISTSSEDAAVEMAQYRDHLVTASRVKPFRDDLTGGPYSPVEGLGDEALWTAVNGSLTVRKGNLSIQINLPKARDLQRGVARKILSRL